jgi:hypothetical protein
VDSALSVVRVERGNWSQGDPGSVPGSIGLGWAGNQSDPGDDLCGLCGFLTRFDPEWPAQRLTREPRTLYVEPSRIGVI